MTSNQPNLVLLSLALLSPSLFIEIPDNLYCTDVKCKDTRHCDNADDLIMKLLETVEQVSVCTLPSSSPPRSSSKTPVVGWNDLVEPFRDRAYFWHQV